MTIMADSKATGKHATGAVSESLHNETTTTVNKRRRERGQARKEGRKRGWEEEREQASQRAWAFETSSPIIGDTTKATYSS